MFLFTAQSWTCFNIVHYSWHSSAFTVVLEVVLGQLTQYALPGKLEMHVFRPDPDLMNETL